MADQACEWCGDRPVWITGGGAGAEFVACQGCREMVDLDNGPEDAPEWVLIAEASA